MGKGWFNLKETNMDAYNFSKMKRYLTMIQFMMEDSLRFLTEDILHQYTSFIERHIGAARIEVKAINDVACEWPKADFAAVSVYHPPKIHLHIIFYIFQNYCSWITYYILNYILLLS